uniref:Reverse transcriptase domain-containing protein n=1 Tax=Tanacetum cinerariifolium TaxID=118510 RepID=A0A6L2JRK8_TANCI|nr:reverse transcriptase domain-containing protein [Tanacetum cinerariifolium]
MEEILAKFIDEERSNLLSELKIKVNGLSNVMGNVLIPKNEVNGVKTRGEKMTSEVTPSKEINKSGINKNEPPRFKQDVQEKPHDVGYEFDDSFDIVLSIRRIDPVNTPYFEAQEIDGTDRIKNKHLYLATANEIDEKKPWLEDFPSHLEYAYLHGLEKHKGAENLVVDQLSRLENPHMEVLSEKEIADEFPNKHLMLLKPKFNGDEQWYADIVNYIVGNVVPPNWTFEKRKRLFLQVKNYFWEEPYAFKLCVDNIMRRCVARSETLKILAHCHSGPTGEYYSASVTAKKVYKSGFYWPSVFKDANEYIR